MICNQPQEIIDTLLRLKYSSSSDNNNKIASIISKPHDSRTKEEKEDLCVHVLNQLMDKDKNQNKVASVQSTNKKIGEVAEFQRLLKTYIH